MQNWLLVFFAFLFGTVAGSFLNVVADRLPQGESIFGRSYCPHCRKKLSWRELVPILSFFLLRGRCSECKQPIPLEHPIVELCAGLIFAIVAWCTAEIANYELRFTDYAAILYGWSIVSILVIVFLSDLKYYIISDKVVLPASVFALLVNGAQDLFNFRLPFTVYDLRITNYEFLFYSPFLSGLFAALIAVVFFLALVIVSRGRWMGLGDVKFGAFMGLAVGFPGIVSAIFAAFFLGSLVALPLVLIRKKTLKSFLPFGTFLAVTTFIWFLWGGKINPWILATFVGL